MISAVPHISICICTYRRAALLERLLTEISRQVTDDRFTFSVLIADNDAQESARATIANFTARSSLPVAYYVEPRRNIALARNRALVHAKGDFIAFIDDDEFPARRWLMNMFTICNEPGVSGVLGPVVSHFEVEPPPWVQAGGFYKRPRYNTGFQLDWPECRTGNVLFPNRILTDLTSCANDRCSPEGSFPCE
jgi:succinoglycan biosynthesis protein ExoM